MGKSRPVHYFVIWNMIKLWSWQYKVRDQDEKLGLHAPPHASRRSVESDQNCVSVAALPTKLSLTGVPSQVFMSKVQPFLSDPPSHCRCIQAPSLDLCCCYIQDQDPKLRLSSRESKFL